MSKDSGISVYCDGNQVAIFDMTNDVFSFPITIRTSEMAGKIIKGKANKKNTQKTKISYLHNAKQD